MQVLTPAFCIKVFGALIQFDDMVLGDLEVSHKNVTGNTAMLLCVFFIFFLEISGLKKAGRVVGQAFMLQTATDSFGVTQIK